MAASAWASGGGDDPEAHESGCNRHLQTVWSKEFENHKIFQEVSGRNGEETGPAGRAAPDGPEDPEVGGKSRAGAGRAPGRSGHGPPSCPGPSGARGGNTDSSSDAPSVAQEEEGAAFDKEFHPGARGVTRTFRDRG